MSGNKNRKIDYPIIIFTSVVAPLIVWVTIYTIQNYIFETDKPQSCRMKFEGWNHHSCGVLTSLNLRWGDEPDEQCVEQDIIRTGAKGLQLHPPLESAFLGDLEYKTHNVELWFHPKEGLVEMDLKKRDSWSDLCKRVEKVLGRRPEIGDETCKWINHRQYDSEVKKEIVTVKEGLNGQVVIRATAEL